jgi:protein SCO1
MRRGAPLLAVAALLAPLACSGPDDTFEATGVVRGVRAEEGQVTIEHGDIEGLMPAMTMSFDVADPAVLEGLEPGQYVEFRLRRSEGRFEIDRLEAPGAGSGAAGASGASPDDPLSRARDVAPDFSLVDQRGEPFVLSSLRGDPVLVDFVFTRCAGPCPILTGLHRDVREGLSEAVRARVHSVSITLDPAYDTPEVLRDYAAKRRLDTERWSFVTGPVGEVDAVVHAWGVGSVRGPDGAIEHTVVTFLVDADGRIAKRYLGLDHDPAEIRADVEALL